MDADIDTDLLDLINSSAEEGAAGNDGDVGSLHTSPNEPIDPLFEDAYEDFKAASSAKDAAEALRLMMRILQE